MNNMNNFFNFKIKNLNKKNIYNSMIPNKSIRISKIKI